MRLKKGFTLAEVLIVLVVIGAIATLTIPSLMKGVSAAQYKTAYKKGLNNIVNIMAMEAAAGVKPAGNTSADVTLLFKTLNTNLAVKDYAEYSKLDGTLVKREDLLDTYSSTKTCTGEGYVLDSATSKCKKDGAADMEPVTTSDFSTGNSDWINTEDGLSYQVRKGESATCPSKSDINKSTFAPATDACLMVVVDANGVTSGPNTLISNTIAATSDIPEITDDRFIVYIGKDGASAGSKKTTVTGRIAADLK